MTEKIKKFWNKYPWVFGIILGAIAILIYYLVRKRQTQTEQQPQLLVYQPPANATEQQTQNLVDLMQQNIDVLKQQLNEQQETFKEVLSQQQQAINQQQQAMIQQIESITNVFESKLQAIADIVNQKQNVSTQPVYIPPAPVNVSPPTPTTTVQPQTVDLTSVYDKMSEILDLKNQYAMEQAKGQGNYDPDYLRYLNQQANELRREAYQELEEKLNMVQDYETKQKIVELQNNIVQQIIANKQDPKQVLGLK